MIQQDKLLSVCIPAYNRPIWFKRALSSVVSSIDSLDRQLIEVIISDDSTSDECFVITEQIFKQINIDYLYVSNQPSLGMAANWNNSIELASGKYVLILHDDDFLLDGAITKIIRAINKYENKYSVLLFGVNVVNEREQIIKRQIIDRAKYLTPKQALIKLLSNSSFVRFPAIVIRHRLFNENNYFNLDIGEVADLDMWIKLCCKYGMFCLAETTCAYTIHNQSLTTKMFNLNTLNKLNELFTDIKQLNLINEQKLKIFKSSFLHQFILAGTYREISRCNWYNAKSIIDLFKYQLQLKFNLKWSLIKFVFEKIILLGISFQTNNKSPKFLKLPNS